MSKSVYVVNNQEQENNALKALIENGYRHPHTEKYEYSFVPSLNGSAFDGFPYEIIADNEAHYIYWRTIPKSLTNVSQLNKPDELIIYDGREENDKLKITKEVYDALVEWKNDNYLDCSHINGSDLQRLPEIIKESIFDITPKEYNNRLIAIIRWVNGEDVFEVEKPKKWVVRSKIKDEKGGYWFVHVNRDNRELANTTYRASDATKFDTREEAESWANAHQEVIEVEA